MLEVFKTQSDYLAFLIGLSFLFLLLICLSLCRIRRSEPFFFGLILFSLSQWFSQWFVLVTPAWNNRAGQNFVADIFVILGLSSLAACGFAMLLSAASRGIATGMVLLILSVSLQVDQVGIFPIFGPVAFFAGLTCSLLTGAALLRLARGKRSLTLSLAALALTVYSVIIPLSLPANLFALMPVVHSLAESLAGLMPIAGDPTLMRLISLPLPCGSTIRTRSGASRLKEFCRPANLSYIPPNYSGYLFHHGYWRDFPRPVRAKSEKGNTTGTGPRAHMVAAVLPRKT